MYDMKKSVALILVLALAFALASCAGSGKQNGGDTKPADNNAAPILSADIAVGDKVAMGTLDGKTLSWTAISKGVGTALLLSDCVVARHVFNEDDNRYAHWKDSAIRAYLNGEFFDTVFNDAERALIAEAEIKSTCFDFDTYRTFSDYTEDKVFLLSCTEFAKYVMAIRDFNYGVPTQAVLDDKIYMAEVDGSDTVKQACGWALRDDGEQEMGNCLEIASYDGNVSYYGNEKTIRQGVRPAMWVYTDKELADAWAAGTAEMPADDALNAKIAGWKIGDDVSFGITYLRDTSQGAKDVTWKVLDETDDAFLLFSDEILGGEHFADSNDESVTWATSIVRQFMNGDEFINEYFDPWERAKIKLTHHATCGGSDPWDVDPGPETDDYLFLLDREEIEKYFPNEADRVIPETPYWLRSPDFVKGWFNYVNEIGSISQNDAPHYYGLRVAMWISK